MAIDRNQLLFLGLLFLFLFFLGLMGFRVARVLYRRSQRNLQRTGPAEGLLVGALRDQVVQFREAENQLQESRRAYSDLFALYQTLMEKMPLGLIEMDRDFNFHYANPAAQMLLQPSSSSKITEQLIDLLADLRQGHSHQGQLEFEQSDGSLRTVDITLTALPHERWLAAIADRTELARLESRLQANRELTLMGEMASGITHEVKNVLGVIQARAQMLALEGIGDEHVTSISNETHRLIRVIGQFMKSSQAVQPELHTSDLDSWFGEIERIWVERNQATRISFERGYGDGATVEWDPVLVSVAINNLIQNAFDASSQSGPESWVRVRASVGSHSLCLAVSDSGEGFPDTVRRKLFVPFVTSKSEGTGLGLFHTRKIVLAHGGRVGISQDPTTVCCYFPLKQPEPTGRGEA